eukprot:CAMPEP_0173364784 /NCGR_PEP_ID=MMETSP1144-20121109/23209_1 /TAXON_ID=483371 /ORGANISM="non described non described, Strain CCMP2298" /LENGTH=230 /DNA_ID=CAMNT_0014315035 /DNA_START=20 /DNA_END=710 /DNA_ORIENTATION=-
MMLFLLLELGRFLNDLAAIGDGDRVLGLARVRPSRLNPLDDIVSFSHLTEDHVSTVQPRAQDSRDEELRAIGARTGIGHGEEALLLVLQLEVLVSEFCWVEERGMCNVGVEGGVKVAVILYSLTPVDRLAAGSVAAGEVASLAHELGDHSVELAALVAEALLASAKSAEVLRGLRHNIVVQLEGDAPLRLATDVQIEEDLGVRHFQGGQARSNHSRRESKGRSLGEHDKE